ncbi:mevalonate kinase [Nocardia brasiliensis]|uniref:mevalonate kinase n=1 Tax=Nocardia brasiliensis TaxID=37326 RepID=UPI00341199F9
MDTTEPASGTLIGTGAACGKAILIGEHTVVYGRPAIAIPLAPLHIAATARVSMATESCLTAATRHADGGRVDTFFASGSEALSTSSDGGAVATALRRWGFHHATAAVTLTGDLPPARGLGASAACATAAVRAVADAVGVTVDGRALYELVQVSEQQAHGRASGVDAATVIAAQPIRFQDGAAHPLLTRTVAVTVLADTGTPSITRQAVQAVESMVRRCPARARRLFDEADRLIDDALAAMEAADIATLGARMTGFHCLLQEFGVSTAALNRLVDAASSAGALGAKLTGGGLGGCMLALTRPHDTEVVEQALVSAGARRTWTIPIGEPSS